MKNFIYHDIPTISRKTLPDGTRVYQTPSGKPYPSVTTVTGLLNKKAILEWREKVGAEEANKISASAANRGTRVHSLCEKYLKGDTLEFSSYMISELFKTIQPNLDKIDNIHALETSLYSDHLEVAGTVDCIAEYEGKLRVIDFKTSSRAKQKEDITNYFMQMTAYAIAFEERTSIPVSDLIVIMAVENDQPLVFKEKRDNWVKAFKALREQYKQLKSI